jgi:hypothetical protein
VLHRISRRYREAIYVFDEAAAACGLAVVTRNEKHFPGCKTVNPWRE